MPPGGRPQQAFSAGGLGAAAAAEQQLSGAGQVDLNPRGEGVDVRDLGVELHQRLVAPVKHLHSRGVVGAVCGTLEWSATAVGTPLVPERWVVVQKQIPATKHQWVGVGRQVCRGLLPPAGMA